MERARGNRAAARHQLARSQVENGSYRAATGELTAQIQSLEGVIDDLGARAHARSGAGAGDAEAAGRREGARRRRHQRSRNAGDRRHRCRRRSPRRKTRSACCATCCRASRAGCATCARDVERREALAAATPSIWPAHGWLTGTFGGRSDPFTGEPGFHPGLDISTEKGQPVYATADGTVESAAYTGDYGNLIVLKHGFGLTTRYGHLSAFTVKPGQTVKRGDVIGYVGSTGRSTGSHLHYEILANGKLLNPLQLLTQPAER